MSLSIPQGSEPVLSANLCEPPSLHDRYVACMLLAAVGDAMGYHRGDWEFEHSGPAIISDMLRKTQGRGISYLRLALPAFPISDDTVMHIATAKAFLHGLDVVKRLVEHAPKPLDTEQDTWLQHHDANEPSPTLQPDTLHHDYDSGNVTFDERIMLLAHEYIECQRDFDGRAPGTTTMASLRHLSHLGVWNWKAMPFNSRSGGCGAAMRAMVIGLVFPRPQQLQQLVAYSIESGRLTHHSPSGYLGAVAAAYFVHAALTGVPIQQWPKLLMTQVIPIAKQYIVQAARNVDENLKAFAYFEQKWTEYMTDRQLTNGEDMPVFPASFLTSPAERDDYYARYSFGGWAGSSGHDAPLIAYDTLLSSSCWSDLCMRAALHGGDSDSTATIAMALWGAMHAMKQVPQNHYEQLEYADVVTQLGEDIFQKYGNQPQN